MASTNGSDAATLDRAIFACWEAAGLVNESGVRDSTMLRERIFARISRDKVLAKPERVDKAVRRGDLVAEVVPGLPGTREEWDAEKSPALAEAVYGKISTAVWNECRPGARSPMQRMVGMNMGNGYVLCRTKVTRNNIDAVYITDVLACIQEDFVRPDNKSMESKLATITENRELLVIRQPDNAERYVREYAKVMRQAVEAGVDRLKLTAESNVEGEPADDDPDDVEAAA